MLYLSDLDGTLLTADATVSEYTGRVLNELIAAGLAFSVATARTAATVRQILAGVPLQLPVVLMNGACVYDLNADKYLVTQPLSQPARQLLWQEIRKRSLEGFVYAVDNGHLATYYERAQNPHNKSFMAQRQTRYGKKFIKVDAFATDLSKSSVIYYSTTGKPDELAAFKAVLSESSDLTVSLYRDVYTPEQSFLEVSSAKASKKWAVEYLKEHFGFDTVTSFGDNTNDLPMFAASDYSFAVANAVPAALNAATGVVGANHEDGVARWLSANAVYKER